MWAIPLFELDYDEREEAAVADVLQSHWLTMGEQTRSLEAEFSQFLGGAVGCCAVSSCTAALHLALLALDIGPGDEVIIPSLTFVADINAVLMVGATPVVADSGALDDWNVSPEEIEKKITPRTKAVIGVHFAGYPMDIAAIATLCQSHEIYLIEDVAHAPGASMAGRACGTFGDFSCFSFFSNKNIAAGEGGMLASTSSELIDKARLLRSHGMTALTLDRHKGRAITYDVALPGFNYRIDEIRASLARVQLQKLGDGNRRRKWVVSRYHELLRGYEKISLPFRKQSVGESAYHLMVILLGSEIDRRKVMDRMREKGVQTSIHYPSFRSFSAYREIDFDETPVSDEISKRALTLPLFPGMDSEKIEIVVDVLISSIEVAETRAA